MQAIQYNVFDDLMIGNFMRTKLFNTKSLYPYFTPYVAKYYDNGGIKNQNELKSYFNYYKKKSPSGANFTKEKYFNDLKDYTIYNFEQLGIYNFARFMYRALKY